MLGFVIPELKLRELGGGGRGQVTVPRALSASVAWGGLSSIRWSSLGSSQQEVLSGKAAGLPLGTGEGEHSGSRSCHLWPWAYRKALEREASWSLLKNPKSDPHSNTWNRQLKPWQTCPVQRSVAQCSAQCSHLTFLLWRRTEACLPRDFTLWEVREGVRLPQRTPRCTWHAGGTERRFTECPGTWQCPCLNTSSFWSPPHTPWAGQRGGGGWGARPLAGLPSPDFCCLHN